MDMDTGDVIEADKPKARVVSTDGAWSHCCRMLDTQYVLLLLY